MSPPQMLLSSAERAKGVRASRAKTAWRCPAEAALAEADAASAMPFV
jgi:hypothetical protein